MNPQAYKDFSEFLLQLTPDGLNTRIGFKLGAEAYIELVDSWVDFSDGEATSLLDNEGQLFLILLTLEASQS